jgi:hypothetical protein
MVAISSPARLFSRPPRRQQRSNPFPGARPFIPAERELFHGRPSEIAELASLVRTQRFCLLYAPSGAGKSSLINAGLLPALTSSRVGQPIDVVGVAKVHPGSVRGPSGWPPKETVDNVYVTAALNSLDPDARSIYDNLPTFFEQRPARADVYGDAVPRLLVIDQFEEILEPFAREDWLTCRTDFFAQLDESFRVDDSLHVLIALREDHFATIERLTCDMRTSPRARYRLDKLRKHRALAAMQEPAGASGLPFDDGVAEKLCDELACRTFDELPDPIPDEFIEPAQLQVVCNRVWAKADADRLNHGNDAAPAIRADHVEQLGGASGSLRQYYEEAIASVPKGASQRRLRAFFDSRLIGKSGTRQLVPIGSGGKTRGVQNAALERLEDEFGIVRTERRGGTAYWELSHDGFIQPIRASNNDRRTARLRTTRRALIAGLVVGYFIAVIAWSMVRRDDDETDPAAVTTVEQFHVPRQFGDDTPLVPIGVRDAGDRLVIEIVQPAGANADFALVRPAGDAVLPVTEAGDLAEYELADSSDYAVQVYAIETPEDDQLGVNVRPGASLIALPDVTGLAADAASTDLSEAGLYVNGIRAVCSDVIGLVPGQTLSVIDLDRQAVAGVDGVLDALGDPRFAIGGRSGVMVASGTTVVIEAFDGQPCTGSSPLPSDG